MVYKSLVKDTVVYGGSDLVTKIINFLFFPIVATYISSSEFGHLEIIGTVITLFSLIVNMGLNNSVQRFYWEKETTDLMKKKLVSSGLIIQFSLGILFSSFTFFLIKDGIEYFGVPQLTMWASISAASLVCLSQVNQYILDVIRLQFAPYRYLALTFLTRVIGTFFSLYFIIKLSMGVSGYLISQALILFVVFPFSIYLVKKDFHFSIDKEKAKEILKFGYPFVLSGMAYYLFGSMDRWMLARMSSLEEVGIYSVGFRFSSIVLFISSAFGQAWSPYAIKIKSDHPESYKEFYSHVLSLLFFIVLVAGGGMTLFSGELIGLIMPSDYQDSSSAMIFLTFGVVLQATTQVTALGISLEKKTYLFSRIIWLTAGINFILNYCLIPYFGAMGASLATAISYLVLTLGYLYYTQKLHPIPLKWKVIGLEFGLGLLVLATSLGLNSRELRADFILIKLAIIVLCLIIILPLLPIKELKNFR